MIRSYLVLENLLADGEPVAMINFDVATSPYRIRGEPYFDAAMKVLVIGYRVYPRLADEQEDISPRARTFCAASPGKISSSPDVRAVMIAAATALGDTLGWGKLALIAVSIGPG
ncbi:MULTISPECIES: hypothetical protein [unclassified Caballeronia]|uniref:hypothetical protein n=1 Tax=unclassified Caballeronia TaxID=2646786 RepID=UPI0013E1D628|nr:MULTISPECIES: hypothetical protein [unclassified Caballeronia]QIE27123.1 hypothetical protein SBC2_51930 [Caballeronia sp. SBC2]